MTGKRPPPRAERAGFLRAWWGKGLDSRKVPNKGPRVPPFVSRRTLLRCDARQNHTTPRSHAALPKRATAPGVRAAAAGSRGGEGKAPNEVPRSPPCLPRSAPADDDVHCDGERRGTGEMR